MQAPEPVSLIAMDIGPQFAEDDEFAARIRLHQSWYRAQVLKLPYGARPSRSGLRPLGSWLRDEDGAAGRNFLTPQIHRVAEGRMAEGAPKVSRLRCNMLSSQPMCFNLFGPLVDDPELAGRLVRAQWGSEIGRVIRVIIEWAPSPASEFLGDRTSFDAFIEYERLDGALGFLGIETKLSEPFSQDKTYDRESYRRWMTPDGPWRADGHGEVASLRHNQLWRNHLLAWSMLRHPRSIYAEGRCVVVRHPADERCDAVMQGYFALLSDSSTVQDLPMDQLVECWRAQLGPSAWLDAFEERYLALDKSAHLLSDEPAHTTQVGPAVRPGHRRAVDLLADADAYRATRDAYRQVAGPYGVYLRPTNKGLTVISLDFESDGAMVGMGSKGTEYLTRLPPTLVEARAAFDGYRTKLEADGRRRYSVEERFALRLLFESLEGDLSLPGVPGVFFVHHEWRLPNGKKPDIIGVDPSRGQLVVLELKSSENEAKTESASKGGDAWEQAEHYADVLFQHRDTLYPFFQDLARTMARLHQAPQAVREIELDLTVRPRVEVLWPAEGMP